VYKILLKLVNECWRYRKPNQCHFWAWLKRPIFGVLDFQGSAETLVRRGGITNYYLIESSFSNISAKNYQNRFMCIEVIAQNVIVVFLRHSIVECILLRKTGDLQLHKMKWNSVLWKPIKFSNLRLHFNTHISGLLNKCPQCRWQVVDVAQTEDDNEGKVKVSIRRRHSTLLLLSVSSVMRRGSLQTKPLTRHEILKITREAENAVEWTDKMWTCCLISWDYSLTEMN